MLIYADITLTANAVRATSNQPDVNKVFCGFGHFLGHADFGTRTFFSDKLFFIKY